MLFESVIVLRFHVAAADLDGIQFVGADAPQKDFLAAFIGVEKPLSVSLDDRNGQRPIVIANRNGGPFGILRVRTNLGLLAGLRRKCGSPGFVLNLVRSWDSLRSWLPYLLLPPPPRPPPPPMLDEPRELLARALLPLVPPEPPPKPPPRVLAPELGDTLRLPTRSPPPPARFAPELLAPPVARLPAPGCCPPPRCPPPPCP